MMTTEHRGGNAKSRTRLATAAESFHVNGPLENAHEVASTLRLVTTPTRLQILFELDQRPLNVGEICGIVNNPSQPAVSHQLALLRQGCLVETRRQGRYIVYQLSPIGQRLTTSLNAMLHKE
ncbi:MAG: metalloregulator ArsR/SmtB family transcription factor [Isosphaeraceae bacterium]